MLELLVPYLLAIAAFVVVVLILNHNLWSPW